MIKSKDRKAHFKCLLYLGIGFAVSAGSTAIINYIQNGSPLKLSFLVFNPDEKWGFGTFDHSIYRGIWNVSFSTVRMSLWTMPLFFELALVALWSKSGKGSRNILDFHYVCNLFPGLFWHRWKGIRRPFLFCPLPYVVNSGSQGTNNDR